MLRELNKKEEETVKNFFFLQSALNCAPVGIFILDLKGQILYKNEESIRLGFEVPKDLTFDKWVDYYQFKHLDGELLKQNEIPGFVTLTTQKKSHATIYLDKDNVEVVFEVKSAPLLINGEFKGAVVVTSKKSRTEEHKQ